MNYSDFEFLEDDYLVGKTYQQGRLTVVGLISKDSKSRKNYAVCCKECSKDPELYGEGIFRAQGANMTRYENISCGCNSLRLNEEQARIKAKRKAESINLKFISFDRDFKNTKSRVILECPNHGIWKCHSLSDFLDCKSCPKCSYELVGLSTSEKMKGHTFNRLPDEIMISKFERFGNHAEGSVFKRSEKKDSRNSSIYWEVYCPLCKETNITTSGSLTNGSVPCSCAWSTQKQAYIKVLEEQGLPVALKFGISKDGLSRSFQGCKFSIINFGVWQFKTKSLCLQAEKECLDKLVCGVVDKKLMPNGFSETTSLINLEAIVQIYKKFGGIKL